MTHLTTQRNYGEKDFEVDFGKWVRHCYASKSTAFELKVTPTDSIPFDRLELHQRANLLACKHRKMFWKIPDTDYLNKRPFDAIFFSGSEAYIVVMFRCTERGQKEFFLIDIDKWVEEEKGERRSLTEDRAKEIGQIVKLA